MNESGIIGLQTCGFAIGSARLGRRQPEFLSPLEKERILNGTWKICRQVSQRGKQPSCLVRETLTQREMRVSEIHLVEKISQSRARCVLCGREFPLDCEGRLDESRLTDEDRICLHDDLLE